jgi:hypothetical protein
MFFFFFQNSRQFCRVNWAWQALELTLVLLFLWAGQKGYCVLVQCCDRDPEIWKRPGRRLTDLAKEGEGRVTFSDWDGSTCIKTHLLKRFWTWKENHPSGNIDNTTLINVVPVVVIFVLQSPYKLRPHCCHWQPHCVALSLHSVLWCYIVLLWYCAIVSQRSELWGVGVSTNNFRIM